MSLEIVILAAGMGTRMKSSKPKVLHHLAGKPMLAHLLLTAKKLKADCTHVVIGKGAEQVKSEFSQDKTDNGVNWVLQSEQLGTGHALNQALPQCNPDSELLILLGDAPLVREETLTHLLGLDSDLGILSVILDNPFGYGRLIRSANDKVSAIVEEKDANEQEKQIREINTGVMTARVSKLQQWITSLDDNNAQGEFILTDIVSIASSQGDSIKAHPTPHADEVLGVNDFEQLAVLERAYQRFAATKLMKQGVKLIDPARFDLRGELTTGSDIEIDVNCVFEGKVNLGDRVKIGPNCVLKDCTIGSDCEIKANCVLDDARMAAKCKIGPFTRLRPGTNLHEEVSIGNFVEVKKSVIGKGTKAGHLSYLGDATIGEAVNIGAGTITCNYDGVNKHETHIGDNVFVGSNSALIAPINISDDAYIAAGSTITRPVKAGSLAIARGRQKDLENWKGQKK